MTPEQQKLLQYLNQMGDVQIFNRKKESIVKAITAMDLKTLQLILDENLTYQDATKEIFLGKLKEIFDEFNKSTDTLSAHFGKCNSKECSNHNKNGVLFCGKNSGKHFNLIIEEDDNEKVRDLYYCSDFKCNFEDKVNRKGKNLQVYIYEDEKADFKPASHYKYINTTSLKAIADLTNFKDKTISKNELFAWLHAYFDFYSSMSLFKLRYKNEHQFYHIYDRANALKKYLVLEEECAEAMRLYDTLIDYIEMNLLKWLGEHEHLKSELILLSPQFVDENTQSLKKVIVNEDLKIAIDTDELKNCVRFQDAIDRHYYVMFDKYKIAVEQKEDFTPFGDAMDKHISLKYQLEQRNIFVNQITYKTKLGRNSFLYDTDSFGKLEKGVQ